MIELRRLTKLYDGHAAVDSLSLTVADGETCVIIGPSGCGKTTTLRMINRLVEPTSGSVLIDGVDTAGLDAVELRRSLGYAIQSVGLFPHLTVSENVATVPRLLGWDDARVARRTDELVALVGLEPRTYLAKYPRQLSGGEAQRVGVARALAADPPVLLMDEPFGAVDPLRRERLQMEFARIQRELRKTVVFVTHDIDEAIRLADRVAIMREGRLVQYDTPEAVLDDPADKFVHDFVGTDRALKRLVRVGVTEVMREPRCVTEGRPLPDLPEDWRFAYSVDADGRLRGWVDRRALDEGRGLEEATTLIDPAAAAVRNDATLKDALSAMLALGFRRIAVVDEGRRVVGEVGFEAIDEALAGSAARRGRRT